MSRFPPVVLLLLIAPLAHRPAFGQDVSPAQLQNWVAARNLGAIRALGQPVLRRLVHLYEAAADENLKARVAQTLYDLGWRSPEAKRALMKDAHTANADLRLQVQWALGRVSNDPDVVDTLLANMRGDSNPLFRDKAACALAYDQIHLTDPQKIRLFENLIEALRDEKLDVRGIALLALNIHTGQTKGFDPNGPAPDRERKIRVWKRWLDEYKSGL